MITKDLDGIALSITKSFPTLDASERRLSVELYRKLAHGQPVPREALAQSLGTPVGNVNAILDRWPGVFFDSQQRVIGYWGLALPTYKSPHRFTVNGQTLSAWCAWDTLFLPQLIAHPAVVDSASPDGGARVHLTVAPGQVERVAPADVHMSFLVPDPAQVEKNVVATFCHFVYFFPSRQAGEHWIEQHPGTFLVSIEEAFLLARKKNELQYGDLLH